MWPPIELVTKDGYDLQFGTNVVGPFLFTELLMPALIEGAKTSPDQHARVIIVSSSGAYAETLHWDTFKDTPERRKLTKQALYYQSKHVCLYSFHVEDKDLVDVSTPSGQCNRRTTDCETLRGQRHCCDLVESR